MVENGRPLDKETMMLIDKFESAISENVKIDAVIKASITLIIKSLLMIHRQTNPVLTIERMDEVITNIRSNVLLNMVMNVLLNMVMRDKNESHLN